MYKLFIIVSVNGGQLTMLRVLMGDDDERTVGFWSPVFAGTRREVGCPGSFDFFRVG